MAEVQATPQGRERFAELFEEARERQIGATIYQTRKDVMDLHAYVTDAKGIVVFDSDNRATEGQDLSRWRDVSLTLAGQYGARVRRDPATPNETAALYVAAPVKIDGKIAGVLTVIKPTTNIAAFVSAANPEVYRFAVILLGAAILLFGGLSIWINRQVNLLTRYADNVREGRRAHFPKIVPTDLKEMGIAFDKMREALAGRAYIERYVQTLAHEIKSPVTGISGAAELLDSMAISEAQQARLLANIKMETNRINDLVDHMVNLSRLELRGALEERVPVKVAPIVRTIAESFETVLTKKKLSLDLQIPNDSAASGDGMLLHLAISNLIKNATDFSPENGKITVSCKRDGANLELRVDDEGPGIPEYARSRIFEKFYSLVRADTGKKSTGLGLNFVKEIATLHGGSIDLANLPERGLSACLTLPSA